MNVQSIPSPKQVLDSVSPKKDVTTAGPGTISGTVNAGALTAKLRTLARHADLGGNTIPILACVTLKFRDDEPVLAVSHFGIDMAMTATIPAEGSGAVCVPLKTLLAFMSGADGETVTIEKAKKDSVVSFTCGAWRSEIVPNHISDTPEITLRGAPVRAFAMAEGVFKHIVGFTSAFVSTEEPRYYLNGVCFELDANKVRVVATDGHRLATREASTPAPLERWEAKPIVPRLAISALLEIIGPAQCFGTFYEAPQKTVKVKGGMAFNAEGGSYASHAVFTREGWTVVTKLIDGTYPDWRRVVPQNLGGSIAVVDAKPFERLARIATGTRNNNSRAVRVEYAEGSGFNLRVDSPSDEMTLTGSAPGEVSAPFEPFGVNLHYLASMAKAFGVPRLKMAIAGRLEPFVITAPESPPGDFAILMPMRV